jgi:hypothetical protein
MNQIPFTQFLNSEHHKSDVIQNVHCAYNQLP